MAREYGEEGIEMGNRRFSWVDAAKAALVMLLATALGILFAYWGFPETNIVLVYSCRVLQTLSCFCFWEYECERVGADL